MPDAPPADADENNAANKAKTRRYNRERGGFEETAWSQVKVGDFLMVESYEVGPFAQPRHAPRPQASREALSPCAARR